MPEFIVRAHSAPVDPARLLAGVGTGVHAEYLAQIMVAALFVSKGHRDDVTLSLVLENSPDYSRAVIFREGTFKDLGGLHESTLLESIAGALAEAGRLEKEASVITSQGIIVEATSFEHMARARMQAGPVYLLDRKGEDVREVDLGSNSVFLLSDHVPMPKKLQKSLSRQGANALSLGPVMLHASQCIAVLNNEMDRR